MKCKHCNNEIADNIKFCSFCGKKVDKKFECPYCHNELKEKTKFCTFCGSPVDNNKIYAQTNNQNSNQYQTTYQSGQISQKKPPHTTMSLIALGFFIGQFVAAFLAAQSEVFEFLAIIPYSFISLILSIISYAQYKDTLAKIIMIIIISIMALGFIALVILFFMFIQLVRSCSG